MNLPLDRKRTHQHLDEAGDLSAQTYGTWPVWKHTLAFPTALMMGSSGTHQLETYLVVGSAWWQVVGHYLPTGATVLDIGCGCAKLARFLACDPRVASYVGFDPIAACIAWNQRYIAPHTAGRFSFVHVDLHSDEYNPGGKLRAEEFHYPVADGTVDVAVAASLFTHLLEPSARHYLREAARALKPGGSLILSLHCEPANGSHYSGDEARIDVDLDYFLSMAAEAGLALRENLGSLCGQDAIVLTPKS